MNHDATIAVPSSRPVQRQSLRPARPAFWRRIAASLFLATLAPAIPEPALSAGPAITIRVSRQVLSAPNAEIPLVIQLTPESASRRTAWCGCAAFPTATR